MTGGGTKAHRPTIRPHTVIRSPSRPQELQYEHYTLEDPAKKLPLDIFEAQPCIGKRIACLNIQIEPENKVSFLITGNTWSFRQRLDAFGVSLGYTGEEQQRKYYRMLQSQDMANEEHRKRVLDMLGDGVFKNLVMRANVDKTPDEGSDTADFLEELKELSNLHWKAMPAASNGPAAPPTPETQAAPELVAEPKPELK